MMSWKPNVDQVAKCRECGGIEQYGDSVRLQPSSRVATGGRGVSKEHTIFPSGFTSKIGVLI